MPWWSSATPVAGRRYVCWCGVLKKNYVCKVDLCRKRFRHYLFILEYTHNKVVQVVVAL